MHEADEAAVKGFADESKLYHAYPAEIEAIHRKNALRLNKIIDDFGWPGRSLVGEGGMRAAWRIAQNAIGEPQFQRRALACLKAAAKADEAPAWQAAMLEDRIRRSEGRPQIYGTQFEWDDDGQMSPCPVEDPDHVDERRRAVGMMPLATDIRERRNRAAMFNEGPPPELAQRRKELEEWARRAGWRD